jgi:hypothetical protein
MRWLTEDPLSDRASPLRQVVRFMFNNPISIGPFAASPARRSRTRPIEYNRRYMMLSPSGTSQRPPSGTHSTFERETSGGTMTSTTVEHELLELEKQYWQAMKDRNVDAAMQLTDDPCIVTGAQGVVRLNRESLVGLMNAASYTLHYTP